MTPSLFLTYMLVRLPRSDGKPPFSSGARHIDLTPCSKRLGPRRNHRAESILPARTLPPSFFRDGGLFIPRNDRSEKGEAPRLRRGNGCRHLDKGMGRAKRDVDRLPTSEIPRQNERGKRVFYAGRCRSFLGTRRTPRKDLTKRYVRRVFILEREGGAL